MWKCKNPFQKMWRRQNRKRHPVNHYRCSTGKEPCLWRYHLQRSLCAHKRLHLHLHSLAILEGTRRHAGEIEALQHTSPVTTKNPADALPIIHGCAATLPRQRGTLFLSVFARPLHSNDWGKLCGPASLSESGAMPAAAEWQRLRRRKFWPVTARRRARTPVPPLSAWWRLSLNSLNLLLNVLNPVN